MSVYIDEKKCMFCLKTKNTEYQMKADEYGVLKHLWYGKIVNTDMSYLLEYPDVGFSGNPYCAGNDRTYSLNTLPVEYSCEGTGDYRISAVSVIHSNGSNALDLRYKGYSIKKGKYSIKGLPSVYANETEAETLEIILEDTASDIEVVLRYGVLEKLDIITRSAVIRNRGTSTVTLNKAASLCLDIPYGEWEWINFHGRHTMERIPERKPLFHGIQESSSTRGTSSHHQNPSVVLCSSDCTEQYGECIGIFFVYSGSFQTQIEYDQLRQTRLTMGIHPDLFTWRLLSGEEFETPEAVMTYSVSGFSQMSHNFHKVIRENICRGKYKLIERPVLINNWEATYFDFDAEKILNIAKEASKLGVDMLVLDDGWFGKRNGDCSGLGDWFVNENKIQGGLGKLVQNVKSLGMRFGIWFEPEMISEDSDLYRSHPDWAIKIPGRQPVRGRYQLLLDMSRQDVQDYLYNVICNILKSADISYIKWDMNRSISDWYSANLSSERQGELPHRYMLGLYALLERLTSEFPDVLFEGCSGGGGRFDAGMLYYCPQIWCSDDTDAFERTMIQYGTSFIYPISTVGSHVSTVPNHQTGRITPIETRAVTAMAGSFGYELDLGTLSEKEKADVALQIKKFKKFGSLIHGGKYYRLSNPLKDNNALWSYVSDDKKEVLVHGVIFRTEPNMKRMTVKLCGLEPDGYYQIEDTLEVYTGSALMKGGMLLPAPWGDYTPVEFYLKRLEK
ncbi:MAG: alpha-galactosidase [Oscillospiraceae bacterium]|nr:alpha-galactosidase [Oscillospiraceae bacterium]